jgi:RNA polymerase primary sigma factor
MAGLARAEHEVAAGGSHADDGREPSSGADFGVDLLGGVGHFLAEAGKHPLLSAARERELGQIVWASRRKLERAIRNARRKSKPGRDPARPSERLLRPLSPHTRRRLIAAEHQARSLLAELEGRTPPKEPLDRRRRRPRTPKLSPARLRSIAPELRRELARSRRAREDFVRHNLRLVVWVAKAFRGRGIDLEDLVQEGSIGLLRATDRFDPALGHRFSTYATHWIRQGILRALAEKARAIRLPLSRLPDARRAREATARLTKDLGRDPTPSEVAAAAGVALDRLEELMPALSPIDSLDAPLASANQRPTDRLMALAPSPLEEAMERETVRIVQNLLEKMPARERAVLAMRYGIGQPRERSLEEIGTTLGLCRERIRQIEKLALDRMRSLVRANRRPRSPAPHGQRERPSRMARVDC